MVRENIVRTVEPTEQPCLPEDWDSDLLLEGCRHLGMILSKQQLEQFATLYCELMLWNRHLSFTAITDSDEVRTKHFLDSLSCLAAFPPWAWNGGAKVIDVGSGPGFPGLPIKIARPGLDLTLLEAVGKKAEFLRYIAGHLGLKDVKVLLARAEDLGRLPGHREAYDIAVSRAVAAMPVLVEYCLPLVRPGGVFIAMKGPSVAAEVEQAEEGIALLGGRLREVRTVDVAGLSRQLVVVEKERPTPSRYPRRPGVPAKRPLGVKGARKWRSEGDSRPTPE